MEEKNKSLYRKNVYEAFYKIAEERISILQQSLNDLVESTKNETKSSAGDKYETGRAMLQIEQDKVRKQLQAAIQLKTTFEKLKSRSSSEGVANGSLVTTDKGIFFVSVALGKTKVNNSTIVSLSPQSPLGESLLGLKIHESTTVNGINYLIKKID